MEEKETLFKTDIGLTLAQDEDFFRNIFKKTEKIACAVFYITRSIKDSPQNDGVISRVEDTAHRLIDVSIKALGASRSAKTHAVSEIRYAHIELESRLRVLNAAQLLPREHLEVFLGEIDVVQRSLNKFLTIPHEQPFLSLSLTGVQTSMEHKRHLSRSSKNLEKQSGDTLHTVEEPHRRDRVIAVLKDKGEATIKDISSVVTDCSEKTIQRELTSLIKDLVIVREGERRWSKYKLIQ